jgi:hypothetical protein
MNRSTARTVANVALGAVGIMAAYVVVTTPPLRRVAFRGFWLWLGVTIPAFVTAELRRAWVEAAK